MTFSPASFLGAAFLGAALGFSVLGFFAFDVVLGAGVEVAAAVVAGVKSEVEDAGVLGREGDSVSERGRLGGIVNRSREVEVLRKGLKLVELLRVY